LGNDYIWRVSADTKRCGSPLYWAPAGGWRLPYGKHGSILTYYPTTVNKEMGKKMLSWGGL
jgi:hypothetical protein